MDDLVDFEELIDLAMHDLPIQNDITSQNSSQEPLSNVLDKMYEEIGESSLIDDRLGCDQGVKEENLRNLDEFEDIFATACNSNSGSVDEAAGNITDTKQFNIIDIQPYKLAIDFEEASQTSNQVIETVECETKHAVTSTENDESNDLDALKSDNISGCQDELEPDTITEFNIIDANLTQEIIDLDEFLSEDDIEATKQELANKDEVTDCLQNNIFSDINSDDDYNSSDFEFISEDEANKMGIINKDTKKLQTNTQSSYRNKVPPSEYMKYSKYRYKPCYYAKSSAELHEMPTGEKYLDMFRGEFAPIVLNNLHVMRQKSVLPNTPMAAMYDDLGFSIPRHVNEDNEYNEDAEDCVKKILSMYPRENRKRRRRF